MLLSYDTNDRKRILKRFIAISWCIFFARPIKRVHRARNSFNFRLKFNTIDGNSVKWNNHLCEPDENQTKQENNEFVCVLLSSRLLSSCAFSVVEQYALHHFDLILLSIDGMNTFYECHRHLVFVSMNIRSFDEIQTRIPNPSIIFEIERIAFEMRSSRILISIPTAFFLLHVHNKCASIWFYFLDYRHWTVVHKTFFFIRWLFQIVIKI